LETSPTKGFDASYLNQKANLAPLEIPILHKLLDNLALTRMGTIGGSIKPVSYCTQVTSTAPKFVDGVKQFHKQLLGLDEINEAFRINRKVNTLFNHCASEFEPVIP
jgi:hypothetical protein